MKKHHREIIKRVKEMAPRAQIEAVPTPGHFQFRVDIDGVKKRFSTSNTPTNADICVRNIIKDVARAYNLKPTIRV